MHQYLKSYVIEEVKVVTIESERPAKRYFSFGFRTESLFRPTKSRNQSNPAALSRCQEAGKAISYSIAKL